MVSENVKRAKRKFRPQALEFIDPEVEGAPEIPPGLESYVDAFGNIKASEEPPWEILTRVFKTFIIREFVDIWNMDEDTDHKKSARLTNLARQMSSLMKETRESSKHEVFVAKLANKTPEEIIDMMQKDPDGFLALLN